MSIAAGFADPVHDAQRGFRAALDALARPGRLQRLDGPRAPGLGTAATALILALADFETPLWLDPAAEAAADYLRFHCGSSISPRPRAAHFALVGRAANLPSLNAFNPGSDDRPEEAATLIVEVRALAEGGPLRLSGPGIRREHALTVSGLPEDFWTRRAELEPLFPRGVDIFFTCGGLLCGLPRTTRVEG